jgi:hypothetical protein
LKLTYLCIEGGDPRFRELVGATAIIGCIQFEQLSYLVQGESCRLSLPDEAQPPHVRGTVATNAAVTRWCL